MRPCTMFVFTQHNLRFQELLYDWRHFFLPLGNVFGFNER